MKTYNQSFILIALIILVTVPYLMTNAVNAREKIKIDKEFKYAQGTVFHNSVESIGCKLSACENTITVECWAKDGENNVMCILSNYKPLPIHLVAITIHKGDFIRFEWNKYGECAFLLVN